jgi:hypothetical protein
MRCNDYEDGERCAADAPWAILGPDGKRVPGGYLCEAHGREIIDEYFAKLGERWTLIPVDEFGRVDASRQTIYPEIPNKEASR